MSTQTTAAPAAKSAGTKTATITLHSKSGEQLQLVASGRADGSATSYIVRSRKNKTGEKVNDRGDTNSHGSFGEARSAIEKAAAALQKSGQYTQKRAGGFRAKPDAFSLKDLLAK